MAYIRFEYCEKCNCDTHHIDNDGCTICLDKKLKEKERMWEAQDIETKLKNLRKRIEHLEAFNKGPIRF